MFSLKPTEIPEQETTHIQNLYFEWEKRHEADEGTKIELVHAWEDWAAMNMHKTFDEVNWQVILIFVLPFLGMR